MKIVILRTYSNNVSKHFASTHFLRWFWGCWKWPKMTISPKFSHFEPSKNHRRYCVLAKCLEMLLEYVRRITIFIARTQLHEKLGRNGKFFDFFKISFVIFAIFLYKPGPTGGGVKRLPIGLKNFLWSFYDSCVQKKK